MLSLSKFLFGVFPQPFSGVPDSENGVATRSGAMFVLDHLVKLVLYEFCEIMFLSYVVIITLNMVKFSKFYLIMLYIILSMLPQ
jgi:hypothetical protein